MSSTVAELSQAVGDHLIDHIEITNKEWNDIIACVDNAGYRAYYVSLSSH